MNLKQFNKIRRDYNRIPLVREIFADLDTPLSAYLKLADEPSSGAHWSGGSGPGVRCMARSRT